MPSNPNEPVQTTESLKARIRELESENTYLRGLLDEAGISYAYNAETAGRAAIYDPGQGRGGH